MTPTERAARFDKLSRMGCVVCRIVHHVYTPAMIHHLTGLKYRSTGKKAKDEHTIPLCDNHHQGHQGVHKMGMRPWEAAFGTQEYLLDYTNQIIAETH